MALFKRGDRVEVASKEQGFVGSYYEATVVKEIAGGKKYVVQYKNLVKDDFTGALKEVVGGDEVRPVPIKIPANGYGMGELVDCDDLDGWWVGQVVGKLNGECYVVYFDASSKDKHVYHVNKLRVHQDWIEGRWVSSKNNCYYK